MARLRSLQLISATILLSFPVVGAFPSPPREDGWAKQFESGIAAYERCDLAAAEEHLKQALMEATKFEMSDQRGMRTLNALGKVYRAEGNIELAESCFRRACDVTEAWIGRDSAAYADCLENLAGLFMLQSNGRDDEAEKLLRESIQIRKANLPPNHPDFAASLQRLAELEVRAGKYEKAEEMLVRALAVRERAFGSEHISVAPLLDDLGSVYTSEGRFAEAEMSFRRALNIYDKASPRGSCEVPLTLMNFATLLRETNRTEEAERLEAESLKLTTRIGVR